MANLTRRRRRSPSFDDMQREMDRVLESFLPRATGNAADESSEDARQAVWSPRVDVAETEELYQVHMDLPGLSSSDLEINYQDGTLAVSGERQMEHAEDGTSFSRIERRHGRFYRSFSLPQAANADEIEASFDNGVLSISIPKTPESQPRRIEVN
ncbi:MAG: heat-shock protein [Bacteroidetes bacterium QS_8_68_15]|nr:MAG: heat-shock protein [Bacteroidetes bacterium QS_8_68_15]